MNRGQARPCCSAPRARHWPPPLRDEIFVRLLAAERQGSSALLAQVERQEAEYRRYAALVTGETVRPGATLARRLAHEAALGQVEAHLQWLLRCRELISTTAGSMARAS